VSVEHLILPTLAVVAIWIAAAVTLAGCGATARSLLARLAPEGSLEASGVSVSDLWVGLALLTGYLLVWNLAAPISWYTWIVPLLAALTALRFAAPSGSLRQSLRLRAFSPWVVGAFVLALLWLANQALGRADDYDFGLYHLNIITYAEKYATIPGLANLHPRLGAADGHLLLAALFDQGPLAGAGPHLVDGLLAALLLFDLAARFVSRRRSGALAPFSRNMALLLAPATVIVAGFQVTHRVSSPNLDFSTFVVVAAGVLYLAEYVETRRFGAGLAAAATLALVSSTRPLYWIATLIALAAVAALEGAERAGRRPTLRRLASVAALPALVAVGFVARQVVLSGYPFFPLTTAGLPVSWRVPLSVVQAQNRVDDAWARLQDVPPSVVLASWNWIHSWWFAQVQNPDVIFPVALGAAALIVVATGLTARGRTALGAKAPLLTVLLVGAATIIPWFFVAPDPRFVWAPTWLVPIGFCAWTLPRRGRPPLAAFGAGLVLAAGLLELELRWPFWFLPVCYATCAGVAGLLIAANAQRFAAALASTAVLAVLFAGLGLTVHDHAFELVTTSSNGPLGIHIHASPRLVGVRTAAGLLIFRPARGDQCWQALLCAPYLTSEQLRLRGSGVADGFTDEPASPTSPARAAARRGR
jgi:heme/copper-type cytochrome/quinol oxidase subunit 3